MSENTLKENFNKTLKRLIPSIINTVELVEEKLVMTQFKIDHHCFKDSSSDLAKVFGTVAIIPVGIAYAAVSYFEDAIDAAQEKYLTEKNKNEPKI
jgi:hypothetical protein